MSYNAILTLEREHSGFDLADQIHSDLAEYSAVTGIDHLGRAQIIITVPADDLVHAMTTAQLVFSDFTDQIRLDVMTTVEYDRIHP